MIASLPHHKRLYVDFPLPKSADGSFLSLFGNEAHYLRDVLRLGKGADVLLFDRAGRQSPTHAKIAQIGSAVDLEIVGEVEWPTAEFGVKSISFALCKGDKNDIVVQKATELSVPHIYFWQADRSVLQLNSESTRETKETRWKKISEAAAAQSGQRAVPLVRVFNGIFELLPAIDVISENEDLKFSCSLSPDAKPIHASIDRPRGIHLLVGPEGDFTEEEQALLAENGFSPVTLGPSVLRSETAAIVAISMAQVLWRTRKDSNHT